MNTILGVLRSRYEQTRRVSTMNVKPLSCRCCRMLCKDIMFLIIQQTPIIFLIEIELFIPILELLMLVMGSPRSGRACPESYITEDEITTFIKKIKPDEDRVQRVDSCLATKYHYF